MPESFSVTVQAVRLDEYIRALTPPAVPYFVKLDLQGLDFDVIQTLVSISPHLLHMSASGSSGDTRGGDFQGTFDPPIPFIGAHVQPMPAWRNTDK